MVANSNLNTMTTIAPFICTILIGAHITAVGGVMQVRQLYCPNSDTCDGSSCNFATMDFGVCVKAGRNMFSVDPTRFFPFAHKFTDCVDGVGGLKIAAWDNTEGGWMNSTCAGPSDPYAHDLEWDTDFCKTAEVQGSYYRKCVPSTDENCPNLDGTRPNVTGVNCSFCTTYCLGAFSPDAVPSTGAAQLGTCFGNYSMCVSNNDPKNGCAVGQDACSYNTCPATGGSFTRTLCDVCFNHCGNQSMYYCQGTQLCFQDWRSCADSCGGTCISQDAGENCTYDLHCPTSNSPVPTTCDYCFQACSDSNQYCPDNKMCYFSASDCASGCSSTCVTSISGKTHSCHCPSSAPMAVSECSDCLTKCSGVAYCSSTKQCYSEFDTCQTACYGNCGSTSQPFNGACLQGNCPTASQPTAQTTCTGCFGCGGGAAFCTATQSCFLTVDACNTACSPSLSSLGNNTQTQLDYSRCVVVSDDCAGPTSCPYLSSVTQRIQYNGQSLVPAITCENVTNATWSCKFCPSMQLCTLDSVNSTSGCDQCAVLDRATCLVASSRCRWCNAIQHCTDITSTAACDDCSQFKSSATCPRPGSGCHWCDNLQLCADANTTSCSCYNVSTGAACAAANSSCRMCGGNVGDDINLCAPKDSDCHCASLPRDVCKNASVCAVLEGPLDKHNRHSYCGRAALLDCPPLTCAAIGTDRDMCTAAGCTLAKDGVCAAADCFTFFLPGFLPQPMSLIVLGFGKDVVTLLILGLVGHVIQRWLLKAIYTIKNKLAEHPITIALHKVVYIGDAVCRDKCNFNFEQYCAMVATALFKVEDLDHDMDPKMVQQRLRDAVAFALVSTSYWLFLPDLIAAQAQLAKQTEEEKRDEVLETDGDGGAQVVRAAEAAATPRVGQDDDEVCQLPRSSGGDNHVATTTVAAAAASPTESASQVSLANSETNINTNNIAMTNEKRTLAVVRRQLCGTMFANIDLLRSEVTKKVSRHAHSVVLYCNSRDAYVSMSLALNNFPTAAQVSYYSIGIMIMFISTLFSVVENRDLIEKVAKQCSTDLFAGVNSSTAHSTTAAAAADQDSLSSEASLVGTASFFFIGFHLMNASFLSTAILVLVKTARAIFHKIRDDVHLLSLAERLPLIGLYSDKTLQIVLVAYFMLIAPFALVAPTYGWYQGWQVGVPVAVSFLLVVIVVAALALYNKRFGGSVRRSAAVDDAMDEVAIDSLDYVASDSNKHAMSAELENIAAESNIGNGGSNTKNQAGSSSSSSAWTAGPSAAFLLRPSSMSPSTSPRNSKASLAAGDAPHAERQQQQQQQQPLVDGPNGEDEQNLLEQQRQLNKENERKKLSEETELSQSRREILLLSLGEFLLKEELPTVILTLGLQVAFNYSALLFYRDDFGLRGKPNGVFALEYDARSWHCVFSVAEQQLSRALASASSFMPFM